MILTIKQVLAACAAAFYLSACGAENEKSINQAQEATANESNLPPDPGVEGTQTLAGIDSNSNGVRDDVEIAIFQNYSDTQELRKAMMQYSSVSEKALLASTKEQRIALQPERLKAMDCLYKQSIANNVKPTKALNFLQKNIINTRERSLAADRSQNFLSNQVFDLPSGETCNP